MTTSSIRRLGPGDQAVLAALVRERKDRDLDAETAADLLSRSDVALFAAFLEESPVGFALAYFLPRIDRAQEMAYLHELDVSPRAQRRGLGRRLVEAVRKAALERGAMEVWVITEADNNAAIATYRAAGLLQEGGAAVVLGCEVSSNATT